MTVDGEPKTVSKSDLNFSVILDKLRARDYEGIPPLLDTRKFIEEITEGDVKIIGDTVYYNGQELHNSLTRRMVAMMGEGLGIDHLVKFLDKLKRNPSYRSVEQLFDFLEACNLPILPDGRFVAYKWVRSDYRDVHSGTFDNSIGQVVEMERNAVNDNPEQTCSNGLHVCSEGYTKFGERLMLVAVDPADVVSVPIDYNASKMRICKYEVFKEIDQPECRDYFDEPVWETYDDADDRGEDIDYDDWNEYSKKSWWQL
jgi:hypothetical protein